MIDFKALTDEKLVDMYRGGDERAFSFLLEKHRKEIDGICRRRYLIDGNEEDVKQYGYMGFMKAAQSFDKDKGSFVSFMRLCVLSTVDNAVKKSLALCGQAVRRSRPARQNDKRRGVRRKEEVNGVRAFKG